MPDAKKSQAAQDVRTRPARWWQWILMYPALFIAMLGAVPQYFHWVSAVQLGLSPFADVGGAEKQLDAWRRNTDCLSGIDHVKPEAKTRYGIDLLTCPSGDILVTLTPPPGAGQALSTWIITADLFTHTARRGLLAAAFAQTPPRATEEPYSTRVIDVRQSGTLVTRRIQRSDGSCVDQTIDALTGRHIRQADAPCTKY